MNAPRYEVAALCAAVQQLFERAGLEAGRARELTEILLEGDLLGHTTHGLALAAPYLSELDQGTMARSGAPSVLSARAAVENWDGNRLPGPWLVLRALERAEAMARSCGTGTVVVRRSHHIACLAAYLARATAKGMLMILQSSDPATASVAPFGGVSAVFTPNPIAVGIPTSGDPILIDVSASYTTNGLTGRLHQAGEQLPHPWLQDAKGNPTRDPGVLFAEPKGTLLPVGGLEAGHKGYGLALMIEAMTGALAGFGRADPQEGWGATVFVQLIDPLAFGSRQDFERQIDWIVRACHAATPRPGGAPVRLPGERGLALSRAQRRDGVALHPGIVPALAPWAERYGVRLPAPR